MLSSLKDGPYVDRRDFWDKSLQVSQLNTGLVVICVELLHSVSLQNLGLGHARKYVK
jgi:hypothetical protein